MKKFWTKTGKLFSLLLATCAAFTACTDDTEDFRQSAGKALDIQVAVKPTSRAMVMGTALPEGAQIGVNVTATDGAEYDGQNVGYLNVPYTATGTGTSQAWGSTNPVMLSGTEGKMYAYFPYTAGIDYTAVEVDIADQHDWMYGTEAYSVSDKAPSADVVLEHAQTALNINVVRDNAYTGTGLVEALAITSEGLASTGTFDTRDGSWSAQAGANTAINIISAPFTLDGETLDSQENPYMFVPATDETKDFTVSATVDGKAYNVGVAMNEAFAPGKMYQLNIKVTNTGLVVSKVALVDWNIDTTLPEGTFNPIIPPVEGTIDLTKAADGVYAVAQNGKGVEVADADESCIGVALIRANAPTPQRIMIAKADATDGTSSTLYWGYNLYGKDITELTNYVTVDGTNIYGWLGDELFTDFTTWTSGVLSDFNGKANTAAIIGGYAEYNVQMFNRDMCKVLETYAEGGYTDWYVPAEGQLALMHLAQTDINAAFAKIGGTAFKSAVYSSSSEYDDYDIWGINFENGVVAYGRKVFDQYVRFVRDID